MNSGKWRQDIYQIPCGRHISLGQSRAQGYLDYSGYSNYLEIVVRQLLIWVTQGVSLSH